MNDFAAFLAPFDAVAFLREYWGKRPLHITGRREGPGLMDWAQLNDALGMQSHWNEETLKLYINTRAALRENYCDVAAPRPAPVNARKVEALIGLGASLVANSIHKVAPELAAVAHMLERQFLAKAGVNAYCSFKDVRAFQTHFDLHDVFALQVEGEKDWKVYEARAENPVSPVPPGDEAEKWLIATRGKLLFEARMRPGDLLYLPRGQYHDALAVSGGSLHLTFWVQPATGLAVFDLLKMAAEHESLFRADLPAGDDTALQQRLGALANLITGMMTSPSFAMELGNHQRGLAREPATYYLPLRRRPAFYSVLRRAAVRRHRGGWTLDTIELGSAYPVVEWIMLQRMFSFEDACARFTFIGSEDLEALLRNLVASGFIERTELQAPPRG